ncbi:MAG: selenocysteine-specific translation elongation factor [Gemmatimonadetes bacterium]|nr:selenocysteine-specific translation elongation factor [Gemmatimonadota bacterium]MBM4190679.1 selenocysteine-specific translation elongation factor [Gemmatimonadota bacterium]
MIIGTAGHIDHGKTALVRALTGVETDRLPEEQRRGITIALGFAPLVLEGVGTVGMVDVPGHEGFVRTMLAGASGIDLALLVIDAAEGVRPQTREHLAILSLLGIRGGVVALTKADLVDEELRVHAIDEVRGALAGSVLEGAPVLPVSALTGEGLDALRAALAAACAAVPARGGEDPWRLPIDRVFSVAGAGTVVTGTGWSGVLRREVAVRILPGDRAARVRGLESHGAKVDEIQAGHRVAVALAGIDREEVPIGATLVCADEPWETTQVLRADLTLLSDAQRLGPRTRVRFHLGTQECGARVIAAGGEVIAGSTRAVRLVLDTPVLARGGDRVVLRGGSPIGTIGGGVVTDAIPLSRRARPWLETDATLATRLGWMLDESIATGLDLTTVPQRLGVRPVQVERLMKELAKVTRVGDRVIRNEILERLRQRLITRLERAHQENPLAPGLDRQEARQLLSAQSAIADEVIRRAERAQVIVIEGATVRLPGFAAGAEAGARSAKDDVLERLRSAGVEPPSLTELKAQWGSEVVALLKLLQKDGQVVQVGIEWWFAHEAVVALLARLSAHVRPGNIYSPSELREALGITRKWLIPFLEWCDARGISRRSAAGRRFPSVPATP